MGKKDHKDIYASCYQQGTETVFSDCAGCGLPPAPVPPCPPCFAPDGAVPSDHLYDQLRAYLDAFCLTPVFVQYGFDFLKNPVMLKVLFTEAFRSIVQTFSCQGYEVHVAVYNQCRQLIYYLNASAGEIVAAPVGGYGASTSCPEVLEAFANVGRCGDCWDGLAIRGDLFTVATTTPIPSCPAGGIYRARAFGDYKCNPYSYVVRFSIHGTLNQFNLLIPTLGAIDTECKTY